MLARQAFVELALSGLFPGGIGDGPSLKRRSLFKPYAHQLDMLARGIAPGKPGIVTSGTGSGKTEAFMLPIASPSLISTTIPYAMFQQLTASPPARIAADDAVLVLRYSSSQLTGVYQQAGFDQSDTMDTIGGDQCMNMVTEVKADGVSLKNGPPGFGADRGSLHMAVRECIPTNTAAISRKAGAEINSQFQVKGIPGSPAEGITLETTVNQKLEMVALAARP